MGALGGDDEKDRERRAGTTGQQEKPTDGAVSPSATSQSDSESPRPERNTSGSMDASRPTEKKPTGNIIPFQSNREVRHFAKKYRTEIATFSSSILSTFVAFPLDFAKSRMQSYDTKFVHTITDTYRAEGIRAFWRGVGAPLISVTTVRTISFSIYQKVKYAIDSSMKEMTGKSPLEIANAPNSYPNIYTMICFGTAGACSGAIITTLSCPFELTKLNEQLAGKEARQKAAGLNKGSATTSSALGIAQSGPWKTAKRLVRDRGLFRGLYAGYRLHLLRDTIGTSIYFITYESVKQLMANAQGKDPTHPNAVMIAGGLCGIVSWACVSHPFHPSIAEEVFD